MSPDCNQLIVADALNRHERQVRHYQQECAVRGARTDTGTRRRSRLVAWLAFRPHRGILKPAAEQQRNS
jgi:hypothetical protein